MSDYLVRDRQPSVSWNTREKNEGIINCHGGGAEVNNCRVNIFNVSINVGKETSPDVLKQLTEILAIANQQLPREPTEHEIEKFVDERRKRRGLFR